MDTKYNVLVISDLHLGEDLGPSVTEAASLHIDLVEKQLVNFFRYYGRRRENGHPWRLVVNGDMVDFMAVTLMPAPEEKVSREEREFGHRRTPQVTVQKMARVAERHPDYFRALSRFLAHDNRLEIIPGNHDAEFHWPVVQEAFVRTVATAWSSVPDSKRTGAPGADEIASRIAFHPWFFYERGLLWVEHGHQYDECCSFENQLDPRQIESDEMVLNVDTAGARYVTNYVHEAESHQQEDWSFFGYLVFAMSLGASGALRLARGYQKFTTSLLSAHRAATGDRVASAEMRASHEERRKALAVCWDLEEETLRKLDDLRRPPVVNHLRRLLSVLMMDKLLVYMPLLLLGLIGIIVFGLPWGAATAIGLYGLGQALTRWTGRGRSIDPAANLEIVSERIMRRVDVRFVVFGHTHEPVAKQLDEGHSYFNTGTWVPSGKPGLLSSFTHFVLRRVPNGGTHAELCQWRDGASRSFTPEWSKRARDGTLVKQRVRRSAPATAPDARAA
jgi:UDP-2,3-diacylglucosamine pyrophosphatase LpxH